MSPSRRDFLHTSIATGGALGLGMFIRPSTYFGKIPRAQKPLRILILGGTGFIGPHQVRYAVSRGHTVTLFNRGRTNPHLFPDLEKLRGDRDGDLEALKGREWDAVIDNSGYVPRIVRQSAQLLKDAVNQYLFVSSISAYASFGEVDMDETAPLATMDDPTLENIRRYYGPLKALCEQQVREAFPDRATIVRPGLIAGPGDRTDRFTYWPARIDRGGEVLAPGDPTDPVQLIDVRDVTGWMVRLLEQSDAGVYNAVGPEARLSIAEMLYGIRAVTNANVSFTWVDADFLAEQGLRPTVWTPPRGRTAGLGLVSRDRAMAKGLTYLSLAVTAKDTLDWHKSRSEEEQSRLNARLSSDRETEVLAAWHARSGA